MIKIALDRRRGADYRVRPFPWNNRRPSGSWAISHDTIWQELNLLMSWPQNRMGPLVSGSCPDSIRNSVIFPAPFEPTMHVISLSATSTSIPHNRSDGSAKKSRRLVVRADADLWCSLARTRRPKAAL